MHLQSLAPTNQVGTKINKPFVLFYLYSVLFTNYLIYKNRFGSTLLVRTARKWNALPANVFPINFNLGIFKIRVNRLFLDRLHLRPHQLSSGEILVECLAIML
jgi:hypothetical protein